jgi:hypothetical protein
LVVAVAAHMTVIPQVRLDPAAEEAVAAKPLLQVQQAKVIQVDLVQTQAEVEEVAPVLQVAMLIMVQVA